MHFLDWVLIIVPVLFLLFKRSNKTSINKNYLIILLVILLLFQLVFSGYRWQMIPGYLIWIISAISLKKRTDKQTSIALRFMKILGLVLLIILAIIPSMIFPVFNLPKPTGTYNVGTTDILLGADRAELITANQDDKRRFMVKAWYPASKTNGLKDPYVDPAGRHGFAMKYGLPNSVFNYLDLVDTHTYKNAPIANNNFPVLIFSHGYHSKANSYYALITELVSHGYVVLAINHTFESTGSTMPNGTEIYFDYKYAQDIQENTWQDMEPVIQSFKDDLNFSQRHPIVKKGLENYFVKDMVQRWTLDISDVISKLESWNNDGFFKGTLNTHQIGVFGHSRGGGAAGNALLVDNRIKAGVNIDGVQWGEIVNSQFNNPFLFISADWPEDHEDLNSHAYVNKSSEVFYSAKIQHTAHSNFMDIPLMIPIRQLSEAGSIDPLQAIKITNNLVQTFFDQHLKKEPVDLSTLSSEYEQLQLEVFD